MSKCENESSLDGDARSRIPLLSHSHLQEPNPIRNIAQTRCAASYRRPNPRSVSYFLSLLISLVSLRPSLSSPDPTLTSLQVGERSRVCPCPCPCPALPPVPRFDRNQVGGRESLGRVARKWMSGPNPRTTYLSRISTPSTGSLTNLCPFNRISYESLPSTPSTGCKQGLGRQGPAAYAVMSRRRPSPY